MISVKMAMPFLSILACASLANAGTELNFVQGSFNTSQLRKDMAGVQTTSNAQGTAEYIVQFKSAVTEADKAALTKAGAQIFRYLPEDALVVRTTAATLNSFAAQAGNVNAVLPFYSRFRIGMNMPTLSVYSSGQRENISVTLFQAQDRASVVKAIRAADPKAQILQADSRTIIYTGDLGKVSQVAGLGGVEFVQKFVPVTTQDMKLQLAHPQTDPVPSPGDYSDLTGYESGGLVLHLDKAWEQGFIGSGQIAAMSDTGLDTGNLQSISQDFQGAIHSAYALGVGSTDWGDQMGHGTHVSGSVVGRGVSSSGKIKGGANGAQLVVEGLWGQITDNLDIPAPLTKAFDPAYNDGARVHTNSWGSANFGIYDGMAQEIDQYMWDHPDFLILFAAGNSGVDHDKDGRIDANSVGAPATAKNCVTVGASKNYVLNGGIQAKISQLKASPTDWPAEPILSSSLSENPNGMAMFSSRGPTADNRIKPDIVAPGTNVLSTRSHYVGGDSQELLWGAYNADYLWSGGTSMATPVSAGFAVVVRDVLNKKWGMTDPSAALVKAVMMHTAFDMYPGQFGQRSQGQELLTIRPNNDEGYGRLDMQQVLALGDNSKLVDNATGVGQGETFEADVTVPAGKKLVANLVYTDSPATPSAGKTLVNNLDLIVVSPDGTAQASHDAVNNAEVVDVNNTAAGVYKVQVQGVSVPMGKSGKQPFALVYSIL